MKTTGGGDGVLEPTAIFTGATTNRQRRALAALLNCTALKREELDRVAGASNGPDIVMQLRANGLPKDTCLRCERVKVLDRDGIEALAGIYWLTEEGRRRVLNWMNSENLSMADLNAAGDVGLI